MLSENLKLHIKKKGWSVRTTATRTGLHANVVSRIIHGKTPNPRVFTLLKLSKGLGLTMDDLMEGDTEMELNKYGDTHEIL